MRRWLKEKPGGVFRVLRSAGALRTIRGLLGEESEYDQAYDYLRRHAPSMDYARSPPPAHADRQRRDGSGL